MAKNDTPDLPEAVSSEEPTADAKSVAELEVDAEPDAPRREVIVIDAPVAPRKKGNRGLSVLLAILATLIFGALLVVVGFAFSGAKLGFLTEPAFYFPAVFFFVGLSLVGLVLNRAGWWAHIIGSVVVGVIVWFGAASLELVAGGMLGMTQGEANAFFFDALFRPTSIVAALLAREVAVWTGAILARRGRALKVRNVEARAAFEKELAELIPNATK